MHRKRLFELGFQTYLKGFEYLNTFLEIFKKGDNFMDKYEQVAEKYGEKSGAVQRAIERCIKSTPKFKDMGTRDFVYHYIFLYDENGEERN